MKKGQFALEFVILVSFTLLFSVVLLIVIQKNYAEAQTIQEEEQVNQIMRILSSEVNLAELSPSGYERTFYIPNLIDGQDYNISSYDDVAVLFNFNNKDYVFFFSGNSSLWGACSCVKPGYNTIKKDCSIPNHACVTRLLREDGTPCLNYYGGGCS